MLLSWFTPLPNGLYLPPCLLFRRFLHLLKYFNSVSVSTPPSDTPKIAKNLPPIFILFDRKAPIQRRCFSRRSSPVRFGSCFMAWTISTSIPWFASSVRLCFYFPSFLALSLLLYLHLMLVVGSNSISLSSQLICHKTLDYYRLMLVAAVGSEFVGEKGEINFVLFCFFAFCFLFLFFFFLKFSEDDQWKRRVWKFLFFFFFLISCGD